MYNKLYKNRISNVLFLLLLCTTECTDFNVEKRGQVQGQDAILKGEARQIPQNSPSEGDFCGSGSALVKRRVAEGFVC